MHSDWNCTLEEAVQGIVVRLGFRYVRGMPQAAARAIVGERLHSKFASIDDLSRRVPELNKSTLGMLARIGALNHISGRGSLHRRDALWQAEMAARKPGPLLQEISAADTSSPLAHMEVEERLVADFYGTGLTVGPHPMAYRRAELKKCGIRTAAELKILPHGKAATTAGCVITRQRPGTATRESSSNLTSTPRILTTCSMRNLFKSGAAFRTKTELSTWLPKPFVH
jgi:error-prone DNA polymerase